MEQKEQKAEINLMVKVSFKKATFNLGKNIQTYAELFAQVKKRFAELQNFIIIFKQSLVTSKNFQQIFASQLNQAQTSIKFEIQEIPVQKAVELKHKKSKRFSFDPKDFEDEKKRQKSSQESKESESDFEQLKIEQGGHTIQLTNGIDLSLIKIRVLTDNSYSNFKKEVGEQYKWNCNLINQNSKNVPQEVYIREISTNNLISLAGMGANETKQIEFGPYAEKQMGKFTKFYQIVYKNNEHTFVPIGNRFGFVCEANKKLDVKELSSNMHKKINELKSFSASEKSTEYIMAKFKEMGINDSTIRKYNNEDLIDILQSISINQ